MGFIKYEMFAMNERYGFSWRQEDRAQMLAQLGKVISATYESGVRAGRAEAINLCGLDVVPDRPTRQDVERAVCDMQLIDSYRLQDAGIDLGKLEERFGVAKFLEAANRELWDGSYASETMSEHMDACVGWTLAKFKLDRNDLEPDAAEELEQEDPEPTIGRSPATTTVT